MDIHQSLPHNLKTHTYIQRNSKTN